MFISLLTAGLIISRHHAMADGVIDENLSALCDDIGIENPLCRGQLFNRCYSTQATCSFRISPSVVCTIENYKNGINPN